MSLKYNPGELSGFDALLEELDQLKKQGIDIIQTERQGLDAEFIQQRQVDINRFKLVDDYEVKVHFLHEGAAFRNQLGYTATGASEQSGLIFDDIVCLDSPCLTGYQKDMRSPMTLANIAGRAGLFTALLELKLLKALSDKLLLSSAPLLPCSPAPLLPCP